MIPLPSLAPAGQLSVSRVWSCSTCGYLARRDASSAACPNCGNNEHDGGNMDHELSSGRLREDAQGLASDSTLSETVEQDAKTLVAPSRDPSTLFIPAVEKSTTVLMRIRSHLGADTSIIFGQFSYGLPGTTTTGYLIKARRPIIEQEIADLGSSLNFSQTNNFIADDTLPYLPETSQYPSAMLPSFSAAIDSTTEQQEDWEIVDPLSNDSKDLRPASNNMLAPDMKPSDTTALEPFDTRYSVITKPQRFFKVGRVFMTLWSEPASSTARSGPSFSSSTIGGRIFSETRRFVVVRGGLGYALCCPIQTYQKRGATKSRISVENHAIVYAAGSEPKLLPEEESLGMSNFSIVMEDKSVAIDQSSRLNFGKVYTVEHNIKVRNVGKIIKESIPRLRAALVKSMGVNVSDGEAETGTETEDNVPRPTPVENQPSLHSSDMNSSTSGSSKTSSTSRSKSIRRRPRVSTFFVSGESVDREVITTDICRYLGNDALVKPGVHHDPTTGRIQEGFYITAYRPPTSAQLADLRADSQKWREERQRNSRSIGGYGQSITQQEARMRSTEDDQRLPVAGRFLHTSYGMPMGQQTSSQSNYAYSYPPPSRSLELPTSSPSNYDFPPPSRNLELPTFSAMGGYCEDNLPGFLNPLTSLISYHIPEPEPSDEKMSDRDPHQ